MQLRKVRVSPQGEKSKTNLVQRWEYVVLEQLRLSAGPTLKEKKMREYQFGIKATIEVCISNRNGIWVEAGTHCFCDV